MIGLFRSIKLSDISWPWAQPRDPRSDIIGALKTMDEKTVREIIKRAKPGLHVHANPPGGKRQRKEKIAAQIESMEVQGNGETSVS